MGKPTKPMSQARLAELANCHRNMVSWALKNDTRCPPALRDKIKSLAHQHNYTLTLHPDQHPNSKLTQDIADTVVDGVLNNRPLAAISKASGLCESTAFKLIRGVKVPEAYPANEENWKSDVVGFLEVAIWKGTRRLAESAIDEIDSRTLPVSLAVALDKLATLKGQPNTIHANLSITTTHRDLMREIGTKRPAIECETNAEVLPELTVS